MNRMHEGSLLQSSNKVCKRYQVTPRMPYKTCKTRVLQFAKECF